MNMTEMKNVKKGQFAITRLLAGKYLNDIRTEWQLAESNNENPFPSLLKIYFNITQSYEINDPKFETFKNVIIYLKELGEIRLVKDKERDIIIRIVRPTIL